MDLFQYAEQAAKQQQESKIPEKAPVVKEDLKGKVFSVLEISARIKNILENGLPEIWVEGEISNFKKHTSGHLYFSLKDDKAVLNCVMWRSQAARLNFTPDNGQQIKILGRITVYESNGKYQLEARLLEKTGIGNLQQQFELLKQKLMQEGLFDASHKKRVPAFCRNIGIITAQTGAAFQDIRKVISQRAPFVNIYLYNARVQGEGAAQQIADGLYQFNRDLPELDVIICGRGGGSLEDLWPFNEEITARAIYASKIPVISAVGHEIDFSIADFVADVRAATPSHAAEIATIDLREQAVTHNQLQARLNSSAGKYMQRHREILAGFANSHAFKRPVDIIKNYNLIIDSLDDRLNNVFKQQLQKNSYKLANLENMLRTLGPESVLNRGYALVYKNSQVIDSSKSAQSGDLLQLRFKDGEIGVKVNANLE